MCIRDRVFFFDTITYFGRPWLLNSLRSTEIPRLRYITAVLCDALWRTAQRRHWALCARLPTRQALGVAVNSYSVIRCFCRMFGCGIFCTWLSRCEKAAHSRARTHSQTLIAFVPRTAWYEVDYRVFKNVKRLWSKRCSAWVAAAFYNY